MLKEAIRRAMGMNWESRDCVCKEYLCRVREFHSNVLCSLCNFTRHSAQWTSAVKTEQKWSKSSLEQEAPWPSRETGGGAYHRILHRFELGSGTGTG